MNFSDTPVWTATLKLIVDSLNFYLHIEEKVGADSDRTDWQTHLVDASNLINATADIR